MFKLRSTFLCILFSLTGYCQIKWKNVDSLFQPLPKSVHVYYTNDSLDGKPNVAYYVEADLKDKKLEFTSDTTYRRRFTPMQFFQKNDHPLLVVNCTFFEFVNNSNLNVVIKDKRVISHNAKTFKSSIDTTRRLRLYSSAIGINKRRKADVAWIKTDSTKRFAKAVQFPFTSGGNLVMKRGSSVTRLTAPESANYDPFIKWKMQTAVGGGPALIQRGELKITNEEERMFAGKAINDKHPRTTMGYTKDGKLIILVIQGRTPGIAEGATLIQEANMLKDIGCWEALNLDGGGSSCLLVNGKETIKPSDPNGQRPVPAVFLIKNKR
ncbi:MAG TPA: phosphodiester glycosidase family protein [Segetibacter sp.]